MSSSQQSEALPGDADVQLGGMFACLIDGELFSALRYVHISNDILFIGQVGDVENVIHLEGADVYTSSIDKSVVIKPAKDGLSATVWLSSSEEADRWVKVLKSAEKHPENVHRFAHAAARKLEKLEKLDTLSGCSSRTQSATPSRYRSRSQSRGRTPECNSRNQSHSRNNSTERRSTSRSLPRTSVQQQSVQEQQQCAAAAYNDVLRKKLDAYMAVVDAAREENDAIRKERDDLHVQLAATKLSVYNATSRQDAADLKQKRLNEQLASAFGAISMARVQWACIETKLRPNPAFADDARAMEKLHLHLQAATGAATNNAQKLFQAMSGPNCYLQPSLESISLGEATKKIRSSSRTLPRLRDQKR